MVAEVAAAWVSGLVRGGGPLRPVGGLAGIMKQFVPRFAAMIHVVLLRVPE